MKENIVPVRRHKLIKDIKDLDTHVPGEYSEILVSLEEVLEVLEKHLEGKCQS